MLKFILVINEKLIYFSSYAKCIIYQISAEEELLFNLKDNKILPANEAFKLETLYADALKLNGLSKMSIIFILIHFSQSK